MGFNSGLKGLICIYTHMGMNMSIYINCINTEVYCDVVPDLLFVSIL
jgi:hypothetical protein